MSTVGSIVIPGGAAVPDAASSAELAPRLAQLPVVTPTETPAPLAGQALGPRDIRYVRTLRISVTDRCNLRCVYCMPHDGVAWLPRDELMSFEEIVRIAEAAIALGIRDFKLTGGEPLLRADLADLVRKLRALPGCGDLSLTTNGIVLSEQAAPLRAAGLDRLTVSLDTLQAARFRGITGGGAIESVWQGIAAAESCGFPPVKLNVVVMRSANVDELSDFAALTLRQPRTVRFIEFMPLAQSEVRTRDDEFVSFAEMRGAIESRFGPLIEAAADSGHGPARVLRLAGAIGRIGFIHAMSAPFCSTCNRLRLTPEGLLRSCLFDGGEVDVRSLLRAAAPVSSLRDAFVRCLRFKPDTHAAYGDRQMSRIGG